MFIASRPAGDSQAPEERHVPIGVGLTGQASRPRNMPLLRSLAGGSGCFYKHGAPNGAFRGAAGTGALRSGKRSSGLLIMKTLRACLNNPERGCVVLDQPQQPPNLRGFRPIPSAAAGLRHSRAPFLIHALRHAPHGLGGLSDSSNPSRAGGSAGAQVRCRVQLFLLVAMQLARLICVGRAAFHQKA